MGEKASSEIAAIAEVERARSLERRARPIASVPAGRHGNFAIFTALSKWNLSGIFVKMIAVCQTIRKQFRFCDGRVAQLGERIHGMDEVAGSIPVTSTNF